MATKQLKRPKPPSTLIMEICRNSQPLIECAHHGLAEVSLRDFYPYLNLDEVIAFAAASFSYREKEPWIISNVVDNDIYDVFSRIFKKGFPWLNKNRRISDNKKAKYEKLNPFNGRLRERLEKVGPEAIGKLKGLLSGRVNEWLFPIQYCEEVRKRRSNTGLKNMNFQNVYPKRGRIVPAYALKIADIIGKYPQNYELLPEATQADDQTSYKI